MTIQTITPASQHYAAVTGWVVKAAPGYYTGDERSQLECWTAFPRLAKIYSRKGWAQKVATRVAGQVIPAEQNKVPIKKIKRRMRSPDSG